MIPRLLRVVKDLGSVVKAGLSTKCFYDGSALCKPVLHHLTTKRISKGGFATDLKPKCALPSILCRWKGVL